MTRLIRIGECHLDLGGHGLLRGEEAIAIEPIDYRVLLQLVGSAPDCVKTESLFRHNWHNTVVGDNSLHQVIGRLRKALGDSARNSRYIQTLPKIGYRFIADIEDASMLSNGGQHDVGPIIVLPFQNYSDTSNSSFLVDGLVFELCRQLALESVEVVSPASITRARDHGCSDSELGEVLSARSVLSGALMVQGNRLRVTAALSEVETDRLVWSESYDVCGEQIFDAHSDLSGQIVNGVLQGPHLDARRCVRARLKKPVSLNPWKRIDRGWAAG